MPFSPHRLTGVGDKVTYCQEAKRNYAVLTSFLGGPVMLSLLGFESANTRVCNQVYMIKTRRS